MTQRELVVRLRTLRETIEQEAETDVRTITCAANWVLLDVCMALGLSAVQQDEVLGYDTQAAAAQPVW